MKVDLEGISNSSLNGHCGQMAKSLGTILMILKKAWEALQKRPIVNENKEELKIKYHLFLRPQVLNDVGW